MTLMDYCMQYIGEIMDGKRAAPEGVTLTETDPMRRSLELMQKAGDIPTLVRMCAAQDGTEIPQEVFDSFDPESLTQLAGEGDAAPEEPEQQPDPDAGKHAFQVLLDCVALDNGLVQYLTQVLRDRDWAGFYKLSQITTKMDLDPEEFLFWLGNKELWADDEERVCAAVMDACLERPETNIPLRPSAAKRRSWCTCPRPPTNGTAGTIWTGTIPSGCCCGATG